MMQILTLIYISIFSMVACAKQESSKIRCFSSDVITTLERTATSVKIIDSNLSNRDSISQVLVVYNQKPEYNSATLIPFEKKRDQWGPLSKPIEVRIGMNGFAPIGEKREGDMKTPSGLFALGHLYTYEDFVDTKLAYSKTDEHDIWIDDPESDFYNQYARIDNGAKSFEKLKLNNDLYNTNPVKKYYGSAIFLHLSSQYRKPTKGCISIEEKNMLKLLKWLDTNKKPHIIMGDKNELYKGI
jgi:L,D-peptidoglycan transpeptidase YkuD (ErfK/YbiS/YcfS/YnhG family)